MSDPKSTKITRVCEICQTQFLVKSSEIRTGLKHGKRYGRFCSKTCQYQSMTIPLEERFRSYVGPRNEKGCIIWKGGRNRYGYGTISSGTGKGRKLTAHRVAWELANGPIPKGLCVLHKCDVPRCVAIEHLFLGTDTDNTADRVAKDRSAKGEKTGLAKLTPEIVRKIRERYAVGGIFQRELAAEYGVGNSVLGRIIRRESWKHIL